MKAHSSRANDRHAFNERGCPVEESCNYGRWCDDLSSAVVRLARMFDENAMLHAHNADLLAACRAIAALADGQGRANMIEVAAMARAAIAKAEGAQS